MTAKTLIVPLALVVALMAPLTASAQSGDRPTTAWGDPDLGGVWDFRTLTPMERPEALGD